MKRSSREAMKLLSDGIACFSDIEHNGMRIDVEYLEKAIEWSVRKIREIDRELREDEVFKTWRREFGEKSDLNSPTQLAHVIFDCLGVECVHRTLKTQRPKTDMKSLEAVEFPFVKRLVSLNKLKKARSTYLLGLMHEVMDGYVHPVFNLHTTTTFRSCVAKGSLVEVVRDVSRFPKGVPIEDVRPGDFVYCFDDDLKLRLKKVLWSGKTGHRKVVRIHWVSGYNKRRGCLDVTPEHKVRLVDGRYVEARYLIGDWRTEEDSPRSPKVRTLALGRSHGGNRIHPTGLSELLDHRFVYSELVGDLGDGYVVHHRDGNHLNNVPSNLEKMTPGEHASYHVSNGDIFTDEDRKKGLASRMKNHEMFGDRWRKGQDHHLSLKMLKIELFRLVSKSGGRLTKIEFDFQSLKNRAEHLGIDIGEVVLRYDSKGNYISRGRLLSKFDGTLNSLKHLRINRGKLQRLLSQRGLKGELIRKDGRGRGKKVSEETRRRMSESAKKRYMKNNHRIERVEYLEESVDVYDLEVEDCHNFIANEVCVHNSGDSPNLQNQPVRDPQQAKLIRRAFIPRGGHVLIEVDYSALEFRGAANFWQDPEMLAYASDSSLDIHRDIAAECYMLPVDKVDKKARYHGKNSFVFPILYGSYWGNAAENLWIGASTVKIDDVPLLDHLRSQGIVSLGDKKTPMPGTFRHHIKQVEENFNQRFSHWSESKDRWWDDYLGRGWFEMQTGFVCHGVFSYNNLMNTPIQGASFHLLLWSLIQINKWLKKHKMRTRIITQVHDSILADVHRSELEDYLAKVEEIMTQRVRQHWDWIKTPLEVEVEMGETSWYDKKPYKGELNG